MVMVSVRMMRNVTAAVTVTGTGVAMVTTALSLQEVSAGKVSQLLPVIVYFLFVSCSFTEPCCEEIMNGNKTMCQFAENVTVCLPPSECALASRCRSVHKMSPHFN